MILQLRPEIALVLSQRTTGFGRLLSGSFCPIGTFAPHPMNGNIWSAAEGPRSAGGRNDYQAPEAEANPGLQQALRIFAQT